MWHDFLVFAAIKKLHQGIKSRIVAYLRKREVLEVHRHMHLMDLAAAPVNLHPLMWAQYNQEVVGIKAGNLPIVNRRSMANTSIPISMNRINTPVPKQSPLSLRRFSRTPIPARAINLIKAGLLALPWDVRIKDGKGDPKNPDVMARIQIVKDCLNKPNDDDSFRAWLEQMLTDFLVYGMGVSELADNPREDRPVKMWAVDAATMQIVPKWDESNRDTMPRYAQALPYSAQSIEPILFYDEDMMVIRDNIATDTPFGTGALEIAYRSASDLLSVQKMAGIAGADQLGRQIFWFTGAPSPASITDFRNYLQSELEGMARVGMVAGPQKPEIIAIDPVSIDDLLLPWQEMLIRMIASAFNMSAMALNTTNDVNRAVGTVLSDMDFRTAIVPVAKRFEESITRRVIHIKTGWDDLEFVYLNLDDPDYETKIEMLGTLVTNNAETPNGMRKALGLKPLASPFADCLNIEMMIVQAVTTSMAKPAPSPGMNPDGSPTDPNQPGQGFSQPLGQAAPGGGGLPRPKPLAKPTQPRLMPLKAPTAPKLKKFSAETISTMSPAVVRALQLAGQLPQSGIGLADDMEKDQPGVLQEISEQLWEYLESLAQHEIETNPKKQVKLNNKWTDLAKKRYGKSQKRTKRTTQQTLVVTSSGNSSISVKRSRKRTQNKKVEEY